MSAQRTDDDFPHHRPNVGVVLFHPDGRVWLGKRHNQPPPHNWQFPQGGVDDGEDLLAAARRELAEETGVTSIEYLGRTEGWLIYDFPADFAASKKARGFKGQKQVWFAFPLPRRRVRDRLGSRRPCRVRCLEMGRPRRNARTDRTLQTRGVRTGRRSV
jgi:8-oxo-dGTP pyrophosphatase MutT (NUDIX family)